MAHIEDRWIKIVIGLNGAKQRQKTARYGHGNRYRVRYSNPDGQERSRSFPNRHKDAAENFLHQVEADKARGTYIDPKAGEITFRAYAQDWLASYRADVSTQELAARRLRLQIYPTFGLISLKDIRPSRVRAWIATMDKSFASGTQEVAFAFLRMILNAAVDDELIPKNPCLAKTVAAPIARPRKVVPWDRELVEKVRQGLPERYQAMVHVGTGCGLRISEVFGLSPHDMSPDGTEIHVRRQVKFEQSQPIFTLPKGGKTRTVPLPSIVRNRLKACTAVDITLPWGSQQGSPTTVSLYFVSTRGKVLRMSQFTGTYWAPAVEATGLNRDRTTGFHALRHHYASVLLEAGISIKAVSEYLGHHDPAFTLRTYTHLMPSSHERTRQAIDDVWIPDGPKTAQE